MYIYICTRVVVLWIYNTCSRLDCTGSLPGLVFFFFFKLSCIKIIIIIIMEHVTVIPIVMGALGTVIKGMVKGLEDFERRGRVETT